ncbi:hypothetical protein SAMN05192550_3284 [Flavobacterium glycines]|uniref:Uncharacterized protein n=1 Tax=Flavobacterium glycines TaxID=551990 RepID=A0A1B9DTW6_9FLAO|nr:hypothetical protein [Flavobacterium glycines]OCB73116.1 hypothetical protein FBGL_03495 [Flavobacterium glycines]GEL12345.1 hypothetical protein FGL01_30840 [Flavobacterium glycines]SDK07498.1 hypothetical protein SAMN05192550_3284 [Flavobacterium glycines]
MNYIYRLLLTFNATSLILVIFLIKEETTLNSLHEKLNSLPNYVSYLIYFFVPIVLTYISLYISKFLGNSNISKGSIIEVENANNAFLPSYLGYFFVALSVNNSETLIFVFAILFVFTFLSQTLYFNPLFLIFGYHFYNISTNNKAKLFVITKNEINKVDDIEFTQLKRINNFTFIDKIK